MDSDQIPQVSQGPVYTRCRSSLSVYLSLDPPQQVQFIIGPVYEISLWGFQSFWFWISVVQFWISVVPVWDFSRSVGISVVPFRDFSRSLWDFSRFAGISVVLARGFQSFLGVHRSNTLSTVCCF